MNDKLFFEILKYVVVFFVSIFLPKKITYFIRNLVSYLFETCLKLWYIFALEITTFVALYYYRSKFIFEEFINYKTFIAVFLLTTLSVNLFVFLRFVFTKSKVFFSIYPSFTIKENEFITNDIQSEKINDIIEIKLEKIKTKFFVFRNGIVDVKLVNVPKFYPVILGFKNYLNFIKRKLNDKNPISLYLQKDLLDSELRTHLFFNNQQFVNTAGFKDIEDLALQISQSKERNFDDKVESILFLYMFICGQSFLDLTLDFKEYDDTLNILYDLDEQLNTIKSDLKLYKIDDEEVENFFRHWKGMIARYYSIAYLEKKDNIKAVDFIVDSNKLNPYFPYSTYEKARQHYINKYLLELIPQIESSKQSLEMEIDERETSNKIANLLNKIEYQSTTNNYQILIEIINRNKDENEVLCYIEKSLEDNLQNNQDVLSLIFIAEAYKYLPLGDEMENKIYVNRIPKVVEILEKAISLDSEFELLYLRIGSLKFMHSMHKSESEMEKVAEHLKKYGYLYSKYGL